MRVLKWIAITIVLLLLPFGALMLIVPLVIRAKVAKVDSNWQPDSAVLFWAKFWSVFLNVPFDFVIAILYNEGASISRALTNNEQTALGVQDDPLIGYPVGDIGDSRGPSVGPGQVLRSNVESLWAAQPSSTQWLVTSANVSDLALVGHERQALWAAVKMMRAALDYAANDYAKAAQYYNGGSSGSAASVAYGAKAYATTERVEA